MLGHTLIVRTGSRSPHPHDRAKAITQDRRRRDPGDTNRPMVVAATDHLLRLPAATRVTVLAWFLFVRVKDREHEVAACHRGARGGCGSALTPIGGMRSAPSPSDDKCMGWRYDLVSRRPYQR